MHHQNSPPVWPGVFSSQISILSTVQKATKKASSNGQSQMGGCFFLELDKTNYTDLKESLSNEKDCFHL